MLFFLLLLGIFLQACLSSELLSRSSNKTHVRQGRHFFGENSNMINLQSEYLGFLRDAVLNVHYNPYPDSNDGSSFPPNSNSLSMAGRRRLDNYAALVATVVHDKIPGHIIETGVWRGGGSILAAKTIEILGESKQRKVYFADSFKGIPPVSATDSKSTAGDKDAHSLEILNNNSVERVQSSVQSFGVNMSHVSFVVGYFNESLPLLFQSEPTLRFSVLRLDDGGFIIIDDYLCWLGCKNAIDDYRTTNKITEPIVLVPHLHGEKFRGAFWRKDVNHKERPVCPGATPGLRPKGAYNPARLVDAPTNDCWVGAIHIPMCKEFKNQPIKMCILG